MEYDDFFIFEKKTLVNEFIILNRNHSNNHYVELLFKVCKTTHFYGVQESLYRDACK